MKFLVIAALLVLLLLLLYSRLYPYLQLLKKILGAASQVAKSTSKPNESFKASSPTGDGKLVRCVACGTWVPAARALGMPGGVSVYCSRECVEKPTVSDKKKAAS